MFYFSFSFPYCVFCFYAEAMDSLVQRARERQAQALEKQLTKLTTATLGDFEALVSNAGRTQHSALHVLNVTLCFVFVRIDLVSVLGLRHQTIERSS